MVQVAEIPETIPRNLHFIWVSDDFDNEKDPVLKNEYVVNMNAWEKMHPKFVTKLWGDKAIRSLLENSFPSMVQLYKNYNNPVMKADLARVMILEKHGGVYLDMDVKPKKNLETLLSKLDQKDQIFVPGVKEKWMKRKMTNWLIIGKPELPIYQRLRERAKEVRKKKKLFQFLDFVQVHNKGLAPKVYNEELDASSMLSEEDSGVCGCCATMTKSCSNPDSVYFHHTYDGTWSSYKSMETPFCVLFEQGPYIILAIVVIILLIVIGKKLSKRKEFL